MIERNATSRRDNLTIIALVAASLALSLFYSHRRIMWSDELFGWMLVTDPSFRHMLHAWNAGADGGGICFYILARLWLAILGHTPAAFRLFSAAGVGLAAAFTFRTCRRFFPWGIAVFSVALLWFSSDIVLWQIMQARFYGLLLAGVAAASYASVLTSNTLTTRRLLLTFGCHTLLAGTHPLGVLYSGVIIISMVLSDLLSHEFRPRLYIVAISGWWILLPSVYAIENTAAVGKPHFWTTRPELADLGNAYSGWSLATAVVLAVLAGAFVSLLCFRRIPKIKLSGAAIGHRPLLLLGAGLLSVPLFVFLISQRGTSLFVDRYLVPVTVGLCFLICQLLSWVLPDRAAASPPRTWFPTLLPFAGLTLVPVLLWVALISFPSYWEYPAVDANLDLLPLLPKDLPIVVERVDLFDQLLAYHRQPGNRFIYLLDWKNVTDPDSPRGEVSGYHQMENWREVGYFSGSIQDTDAFLANTPDFVVIHNPGLLWFEHRIRHNSHFEAQALVNVRTGPGQSTSSTLWLVHRRSAPVAPHP